MKTTYEISTRLVCWGDFLNPVDLANDLSLDQSFCSMKTKGEILAENKTSISKTGLLSFAYDHQFPENKHDPEKQLNYFLKILSGLNGSLHEQYKVEQAELQISQYYKNAIVEAEVDFLITNQLMVELVNHRIEIRLTVLP